MTPQQRNDNKARHDSRRLWNKGNETIARIIADKYGIDYDDDRDVEYD